jgi:hypothetical protein
LDREVTMMWKDPTKRTPEEIAADEARYEDQIRRLKAMIEKYRRLGRGRDAISGG